MGISKVGVVGCGSMGSGIAEVCAGAGVDVRVAVRSAESARRGRRRIEESLDRALRKGRIGEERRMTTLDRIAFTTDLWELGDRDFVVETISEDAAAKCEVFTTLDAAVADPEAVLASNTSSLPIAKLARATGRPEYVVGTHFFNPVPALPLVEVGVSLLTSRSTADRTSEFITGVLGKQVIRSADRSGFVVNALLVPYLMSAIRMLESGFASADDIDAGMVLGCGHPMGPLRLADLIGLDTLAAVAVGLYEEYREPLYAPPPLLSRMVDGGLLGKKSGRGFHGYPEAAETAGDAQRTRGHGDPGPVTARTAVPLGTRVGGQGR